MNWSCQGRARRIESKRCCELATLQSIWEKTQETPRLCMGNQGGGQKHPLDVQGVIYLLAIGLKPYKALPLL